MYDIPHLLQAILQTGYPRTLRPEHCSIYSIQGGPSTFIRSPSGVWDLYHRAVAMVQNIYRMASPLVYVDYGVHTGGFRFDKPLGLSPPALSKPEATPVYPINHLQPSYQRVGRLSM